MTKKKSKPVEQSAPEVAAIVAAVQADPEYVAWEAEREAVLINGTGDGEPIGFLPTPDYVGPLPMGGASVAYVLPSGAVRPATIIIVNADATVYLKVAVEAGDGLRSPYPVSAAPYDAAGAGGTWHWPEAV